MRTIVLMMLVGAAPLNAQAPRWGVDITPASYVEAWDLNDRREVLNGVHGGVDRLLWRGVAIRTEGTLMHVRQEDASTWVRGATVGMRVRRGLKGTQLFVDVAGGRSHAHQRVPTSGTRSNYILLLGAGVETPHSRAHFIAGVRWYHLSNNGSEGRGRNPDIQALGIFAGIGHRF